MFESQKVIKKLSKVIKTILVPTIKGCLFYKSVKFEKIFSQL